MKNYKQNINPLNAPTFNSIDADSELRLERKISRKIMKRLRKELRYFQIERKIKRMRFRLYKKTKDMTREQFIDYFNLKK
jgi:hypothetical protein